MSDIFTKELLMTNGIYLTRSLFQEVCKSHDKPIMCLIPHDPQHYPCLRDYYVELCTEDPSEYVFAQTVFGSMIHWEKVKKCSWFQDYYTEYKLEADTRRKSLAFETIIHEVKTKGKNSYGAAKYLIEEPWKDKKDPKVKEEVKKSTQRAASPHQSDIKRLKEEGLLN